MHKHIGIFFYDEQNLPITNMRVIGWKCVDTDCTQVTTIIPQLSPEGIISSNQNFVDITFPTINQRYLLLFFHDNYIYKYFKTTPSADGRRADYIFSQSDTSNPFRKKADCKAPSTLSISNQIGEWLPLTIDTASVLDTDTASAISPLTTTYYPYAHSGEIVQ